MSRKSLCSLVRKWALCFLTPLYQKYWLALTLILRLLYLSYIECNLVSEIKVYINLGIRVHCLIESQTSTSQDLCVSMSNDGFSVTVFPGSPKATLPLFLAFRICFQLSILRIILHCLPVSNLCGTLPTYRFFMYCLPWWALMLTPSGNTHELLLRVPYPGLQVSEASLFCISLGYLNTLNLAYLKLGPIIRYKMVFISTISSNIFGVAKLKLQAILNSLCKWYWDGFLEPSRLKRRASVWSVPQPVFVQC